MNVAIIGAGWLGQPLAHKLKDLGYQVIATCRDTEKAQRLCSEGLQAVTFSLGDALPPALRGCDAWMINLPPGRRSTDLSSFRQSLQSLIEQGFASGLQRLIFISTTSVYGGLEGDITCTEHVAPITESAKTHVAIEQLLQQQYASQSSILRLAGLVGGGRHPINTLAGRALDKGQHPVNLIHRDDVIRVIVHILEQGLGGLTLHLCSLEHPSRQDYYTWCAQQKSLAPPTFTQDSSPGRKIRAQASWKALRLEPFYPSPYDMLD